jgi:hypothetical protein
MTAQTFHPLEYVRQTKSCIEALKAEVRAHANFAKLTGEVEIEHRKGEEFARHSVCHSRWELQGPQGTLTVHSSFANDFGCSLTTRLTLKPHGTASAECVFGIPGAPESSVQNIAPTIARWVEIITNSPANPFDGASLPAASNE